MAVDLLIHFKNIALFSECVCVCVRNARKEWKCLIYKIDSKKTEIEEKGSKNLFNEIEIRAYRSLPSDEKQRKQQERKSKQKGKRYLTECQESGSRTNYDCSL